MKHLLMIWELLPKLMMNFHFSLEENMEDKKYVNITKVYTKRGDKGETDLLGGSTARKDSLKVESYGCVDEASSFIGVARYYFMSFLLSLLMGITYIPMSGGKLDKGVGGFITLLVLCSVILPILVGLKVGTSGERLNLQSVRGNDASYDDDGKWLWGMFYYNPNDPATLVPKKVGIGYTINVATTAGKIFIAVILLIILFSILLPFIL